VKVCAGQRFDRLVTVSDAGRSADGHRTWLCRCDCGAECVRQSNVLQTKAYSSCGCAARDLHVTHGMRGTPEYSSWQAAKRRCHNSADKDFHRYGARGIRMCDEWRNCFEAFFAYMGPRPAGTSLERKNVDCNYEPGNCVWATPIEQSRNRRTSVYVEFKGTRLHLMEVAESLGITYGAAFMRLKRGQIHGCVRV